MAHLNIEEIDYRWNRNWVKLPHVILIVCGSSASWIIKKIINNKGGLYNRVTCRLKLMPFSLGETRDYLVSKNIKLNDRHVLSLYMALGGVPYYLGYVEKGLSAEKQTFYGRLLDISKSKAKLLCLVWICFRGRMFEACKSNN